MRIPLKANTPSIVLISLAIVGFSLIFLAALDLVYASGTGPERAPMALVVSGATLMGASMIGAVLLALLRLSSRRGK